MDLHVFDAVHVVRPGPDVWRDDEPITSELCFYAAELFACLGGPAFFRGSLTATDTLAPDPSRPTAGGGPCPGSSCELRLAVDPYASGTLTDSRMHTGAVLAFGWVRLLTPVIAIGGEYEHAFLSSPTYNAGVSTVTETCHNLVAGGALLTCAPGASSQAEIGTPIHMSSDLFRFTVQVALGERK